MRLEDVQIGQRVRATSGRLVGVVVETNDIAVRVKFDDGRWGWLNVAVLEPVAPVIDWQARAERAEADADRLADYLLGFCMCAEYAAFTQCPTHAAHDEAVAQR